jgi:hypothetical protein
MVCEVLIPGVERSRSTSAGSRSGTCARAGREGPLFRGSPRSRRARDGGAYEHHREHHQAGHFRERSLTHPVRRRFSEGAEPRDAVCQHKITAYWIAPNATGERFKCHCNLDTPHRRRKFLWAYTRKPQAWRNTFTCCTWTKNALTADLTAVDAGLKSFSGKLRSDRVPLENNSSGERHCGPEVAWDRPRVESSFR